MTPVEVLLRALDTVQAAIDAESKDGAVRATREVLAGLDSTDAIRVASALACEWAWSTPTARRLALRVWVDRIRLEASWHVS